MLKTVNLSGCSELTYIDLSGTAITSIDLSPCPKIRGIDFRNCKKLESVNLTGCTALEHIGGEYFGHPFSGCKNAEVKLPISITEVQHGAFGSEENNFCKKVLVPNEQIKELVKNSGYPADRIEMY